MVHLHVYFDSSYHRQQALLNSNTEFNILSKQLHLHRFPAQHKHSSLQAWDSADEYLLNYLGETYFDQQSSDKQTTDKPSSNKNNGDENSAVSMSRIAILNDDFGALSCALAEYSPTVYSDSFMAHKGIDANCQENALASPRLCSSLALANKLAHTFDVVIIKIPKTLALLEQQLYDLRANINENTTIIAGAKVKAVTTNVLKLFEQYIGTTTSSLAVKKSRLIFASLNTDLHPNKPSMSIIDEPSLGFTLYNHANVFSRKQLDIGARLLLDNLPQGFRGNCIDLGCGNGVLGIKMLLENPKAKVKFVDESFMAIESAKLNAQSALQRDVFTNQTEFSVGHSLQELQKVREVQELNNTEQGQVDLVLCNPPFHQQNALTEQIAWQMFVDAKRALKPEGELRIVANRHLPYFAKLKRLFGSCKLITNNRKFVVLSSIKERSIKKVP